MIDIKVDVNAAIAAFGELGRSQLPYAMQLTVNNLAFESMNVQRRELPKRFTIRKRGLIRQIRYKKATKRNMMAVVYADNWIWGTQEHGGSRTPRSHRYLRVPVSEKSRRVRARGKTFVMGRGRKKVVARRVRGRVQVLDVLVPVVHHRPRFGMVDTVSDVVRRSARKEFVRAFERAIRTSRRFNG